MIRRSEAITPTSEGARAVPTPVRTPPIDESQCEAWYDGEDAIEALQEYDEYDDNREYELPLTTKSFELGGSRSCAVSVPGRGVSARHCLLERRGRRFLVHDLDSTNGTIHDGRRIRDAVDLNPGDRFTAVPVTFVALNRVMRTHRPLLVELLGTDFAPSPDKVMVEAAKGLGNLLITGESGCEHHRLAEAIHAMSLLRNRPPVSCTAIPVDRTSQVTLIKRAGRSTLVLTLTERTPSVDSTFCSMLFSRDFHVRVIVIAPTQATARRVLSVDEVDRMQHVWIRPIAVRAGELPVLFDRLLAERDAPIRLASLALANRERLIRHEWRANWEDLRMAADRFTAIARISTWEKLDWRQRAAALGIAKSTLYDWHKSLRLSMPLFA